MNARTRRLAIPAAAACAVLILVACGGEPPGGAAPSSSAPADANAAPVTAAEDQVPDFSDTINQVEVTLYFLRADGEALVPEKRRVFRTTTVNDRARQAVQALIDGPEGGLLPSLPPGTRLLELFVDADGTAYVDFGPEMLLGIGTGTSDAVYTIYSIVDTLADNFEEIRRVKILVDGDEAGDVGGHFDLSRPILPEMSIVSRRARRSRG